MKRMLVPATVFLVVLGLPDSGLAKEKKPKPGPMTGTWECIARGGPQGDTPFTLYLEQTKENITGSVSSPMGSTEITSGTFKKKKVEIHLETSQGNYLLTAKFKKDQLNGEWSQDNQPKGTWEGKKKAQAKP